MHPLCVCMSTSQELCWWQMVMSAQKVLCFSGFLAVDCFLKSIFLKTRTKNVSFCFSNYNTRGSALGQNCMNCWCRTLSCASKAGLHDIPSKAVKLCSYMYIYMENTPQHDKSMRKLSSLCGRRKQHIPPIQVSHVSCFRKVKQLKTLRVYIHK